jgi:hypothetical protein
VGASQYSSCGRAYLFYSGSIITENASGADVMMTGEASSDKFGNFLASGDFNADGKTDLTVGAYEYDAGGGFHPGRVYIFYNDGSIPTTAATADVTMTGPAGLSILALALRLSQVISMPMARPIYPSGRMGMVPIAGVYICTPSMMERLPVKRRIMPSDILSPLVISMPMAKPTSPSG